MKLLFLLSFCLSSFAVLVQAESTLDKYMKKNTESDISAKNQTEVAGINKVYKSSEGYWKLDDNRAIGGPCAITYVTPAYLAAFIGPSKDNVQAFMYFNGPTIPGIKKEKRKQVTITGVDGLSQTTQAIHAPDPVHKEMGSIIFGLSGIQAAMDELSDVEHVTIVMEKKQVFSIKWKGGHKARAAMVKCLRNNAQPAGAK